MYNAQKQCFHGGGKFGNMAFFQPGMLQTVMCKYANHKKLRNYLQVTCQGGSFGKSANFPIATGRSQRLTMCVTKLHRKYMMCGAGFWSSS